MLVVVPTPKDTTEYMSFHNSYDCLKRLHKHHDFRLQIENLNKTGLSKLYNEFIKENEYEDIIVFVHDDLEIHDQLFFEKVKRAHEQYDIIGLAGATTQNYTTPAPSVWHLSKEKPTDPRGIVSHFIPKGYNGVDKSHFNSAYFGPTPDQVVVIDGLFMSIKVKPFVEKGVRFDEDFNFHHYDMAMCLDAVKKGLTIGVWPIFCVHYGLGEFNTPEWRESDKLFKQKYGNIVHKI